MNKFLKLFCLLTILSCGKEEFIANKSLEILEVPPTFTSSLESCANHTLIRPPVDLLFIWDDTSSQYFVNEQTKAALRNTISLVSDRFDYHIFIAPLSGDVTQPRFLVTRNTEGLSSSALNLRVNVDQAVEGISQFSTSTVSNEIGLFTSHLELTNNSANGIFRRNAHTMVILMSNGNDQRYSSNGLYDPISTNTYISNMQNNFNDLRASLNPLSLRFISLVPHQSCIAGWKIGSTYRDFSKLIHEQTFDCANNPAADFECSRATPDSHDICGLGFNHLFDAVNNSISDTVIKHRYNFWPISFQREPLLFNPETIKVYKSNGEQLLELPDGVVDQTGWHYIGYKTNHPTSYEPVVGENVSAHMISLHRDAKVSYPECLIVSYDSPTYFYGYIALNSRPFENSIIVKINGQTIPKDPIDGWSILGVVPSQNLRVMGDNHPASPLNEAYPAEVARNKFILKLSPNYIYQSGDNVEVKYDPATN